MNTAVVGFGDFLLLMADRLDQGEASTAAVLDCLEQVNEAFDRQLDPAVEFEAYAALRFCQAIQGVLEQAS